MNCTVLERLSVVAKVAVQEAGAVCDLEAQKLQPKEVAFLVQPTLQKWNPVIQHLHEQVVDDMDATRALVCAAQGFKDAPMIGILLCLRDLVDGIDDGDLASACRNLPNHGLEKFITWLEE